MSVPPPPHPLPRVVPPARPSAVYHARSWRVNQAGSLIFKKEAGDICVSRSTLAPLGLPKAGAGIGVEIKEARYVAAFIVITFFFI